MNNTKRSKAGAGLAGAVVVAGASQAYGMIIQVAPPTNIVGLATRSVSEYWDAETGTTSTTNVAGVSDFRFRVQNSSTVYGGKTLTTAYSFIANLTGATTAATPASSYALAYSVPKGSTIGTGGAFTNFNNTPSLIQLAGFNNTGAQTGMSPTGTPEYVGFQFTASDGLLHDGYVQVETDPYTSASSPGGLTFFSAAYNSVADVNGGVIAAGASVPEPGTLSALAAGAALLVGVGRSRRRGVLSVTV